jgi:tyrosinase
MAKPSKLDRQQFPGALNRYDDFVVVHMNQTLSIHGTVRKKPED